ncbi:MAG: glycosyltransferase [Desulfovibrionaceae bacterium]|nr:glycosyltransferase [Desulfovibrionaceae bacterium]
MDYLFLHHNYPAQFRALAIHLAKNPANRVVFLAEGQRRDVRLPGVRLELLRVPESSPPSPYLLERDASQSLRRAEIFASAMLRLRIEGFRPKAIYYHGAWGCGFFCADIFPKARRLNYCEWFFNKTHPDDLSEKVAEDPGAMTGKQAINLMCLHALADCPQSVTPTNWQKAQQPGEFTGKIAVIHDGIDTDFFIPAQEAKGAIIQALGLPIPPEAEILTYISRGLEPMRGFPQFFRSLPAILESRPNCQVIIMGDDTVVYGEKLPAGQSWLEILREEVPLPPGRAHILPSQPYQVHRRLLQISDLHVYLTKPFILSWSILEAMSCGCLLLASDTEPVREIAQAGRNMLTVPLDDPQTLAEQACEALARKKELAPLQEEARRTILEDYSLHKTLPVQLDLLHGIHRR